MFRRYLTLACLVCLILISSSESNRAAYNHAPATPSSYFAATGQRVQGAFLEYWTSRGGLQVFGYPLTPAFWERGYVVQYFERARMEYHPEWAGSVYEVSLGQLGKEKLAECRKQNAECGMDGDFTIVSYAHGAETAAVRRGSSGFATQRAERSTYFPETGYSVGGAFLDYWEKHGGLAQFGYPLTPELEEMPGGLTFQYFERARFELHPEFEGTEYHVLLTLLGVERAARLDPSLRARWVESLPHVDLRVQVAEGEVGTLAPVTVTSKVAGELRVLGGDNRHYATYRLEGGKPLVIYAAGAPGPQSFILMGPGGALAARWNAFWTTTPRWGVQTGDPVWDGLYARVGGYLGEDRVEYTSPDNALTVHGYRSPDNKAIWLRDHVYQLRGARYFAGDMKSALDYFRTTQRGDGSLDDFLYHTPATPVFTGQVEIEADREFLFVEGVWSAWQATGDDSWVREMLPAMRRALEHTFTDPRRWSSEHGLVKRAFTIDMWDYEQGSDGTDIRRNFDAQTRWSIMHGDNTGTYRSARLLAEMERRSGQLEAARLWDSRADRLLESINRVCWNGSFYTHQVHLTPILPTGVDERRQISLSNAYALNRGTLSQEQAASVIRTYQTRQAENGERIFAEWYSINPPFEANFGLPGRYANGGVMPLVGGELARGAFTHGFEGYGVDILRRYWDLTERWGGSYLWYHPDGRPGLGTEETIATDGWGSAAMLAALTEGLAGVNDDAALFQSVTLSPRWAATDRRSAQVALQYPASGAYFAYEWQAREDGSISLTWGGRESREVRLHLLLPQGMVPSQTLLNGAPTRFSLHTVEKSVYLDATLPGIGRLDIE